MTATADRLCEHQAPKELLRACTLADGHQGEHVFPTALGDGRTLFTVGVGGRLRCVGRSGPEGRARVDAEDLLTKGE